MRCLILISVVIVNVQDILGANDEGLDTCEKDACSSSKSA